MSTGNPLSKKESANRQLTLNFPAQPQYRFSNFVQFQGSRIAFEAANEICSGDPAPYNTLFISGEKGLGKTHLLISIGNEIAENSPDKKALYIRCEDFIHNIDNEEESSDPKSFKQLAEVDYFLMDDVDRICGHKKAQEKLYYIYNEVTGRDGKMVFSGRKNPDQLSATESFLRSRFKWGMTAEIQKMDDAASAQLIKKLCRDMELDVPDNISAYLLNRIPRDYPSLKNAVTKINQESLTRKRKVTLPLVKEALGLQ
ncbi:MAG: ATP-binding protein [Nitrospinae bacterium]|nr:ATP-binding protein [Nitrospinota bacterium]